MNARHTIMTGLAVLSVAGAAYAQAGSQTQTTKGQSSYSSVRTTGEVVWVEGNQLLAKVQPSGNYQLFQVQPGREFMIDGQKKLIGDLKPGTVLNAVVVTRTTPVDVRTTSTLSGTVLFVQGNLVILSLANGDVKEYQVPDSYKFNVDGRPASVSDLRKGMKVTATKIVEEEHTEIASDTVITGTAPKK
jgi:hypothetical protein